MELDDCIRYRKSVRNFTTKTLPFEKVGEILDAARFAPSSGNAQNWRFIIIKENKEKVAVCCEGSEWVSTAQYLIVVCSDQERMKQLYGPRGEALYAVQNCSAAIQNMLLKAHDLGIASCWIGQFDEHKLNELLGIPQTIRPQAIIAYGYGDEPEMQQRESLKNNVYFEKWGSKESGKSFLPLFK